MAATVVVSEWGEGNPETEHTGHYVGVWPNGSIAWDAPQPHPPLPPQPDPPNPPGPDAPVPPPVKRPKPPKPA